MGETLGSLLPGFRIQWSDNDKLVLMYRWAGSWKVGHDSDTVGSQLGVILPPQGIFGNIWAYF